MMKSHPVLNGDIFAAALSRSLLDCDEFWIDWDNGTPIDLNKRSLGKKVQNLANSFFNVRTPLEVSLTPSAVRHGSINLDESHNVYRTNMYGTFGKGKPRVKGIVCAQEGLTNQFVYSTDKRQMVFTQVPFYNLEIRLPTEEPVQGGAGGYLPKGQVNLSCIMTETGYEIHRIDHISFLGIKRHADFTKSMPNNWFVPEKYVSSVLFVKPLVQVVTPNEVRYEALRARFSKYTQKPYVSGGIAVPTAPENQGRLQTSS